MPPLPFVTPVFASGSAVTGVRSPHATRFGGEDDLALATERPSACWRAGRGAVR